MPGVRVVEGFAFRNCKALTIVECDKLEIIGDYAFNGCKSLRSINLPSAKIVKEYAFAECYALADVECGKLEIIEDEAFYFCESLRSIDLPSAKIVEGCAFYNCTALTNVVFGKELESIEELAFSRCTSLERITIPLKDGIITDRNIFQDCYNLEHVHLVEEAVLRDTIDALLLEEWRNDMDVEIGAINQSRLPTTPAGGRGDDDEGEKAQTVQLWIKSVLGKIIYYKAKHRSILNEAATTLQSFLPNDIVLNNILPFTFREMPSYTFQGEEDQEEEEGDVNDLGIELLLEYLLTV
eukprot:scaffold2525_cov161-Skeletonema_marinoi.AAC.3